MGFSNFREILRSTSGLTAFKLLMLTAEGSRPALTPVWKAMLAPFKEKDGVRIRYRQNGRSLTAFLRDEDRVSDLHSALEVVVREVYPLDPAFDAEVVIDGGCNIGLFTLQAAAVYPKAAILMCEPLPRNIAALEQNTKANGVSGRLLPVCIGGGHRTIPFYCRDANASSFDGGTPYTSVMSIEVLTLNEILDEAPAQRILIKLDIEGMEIETLESFVPGETRAVVVFGELHQHPQMAPGMRALFAEHGWTFEMGDASGEDAIFEARSPAAQALGVLQESRLH